MYTTGLLSYNMNEPGRATVPPERARRLPVRRRDISQNLPSAVEVELIPEQLAPIDWSTQPALLNESCKLDVRQKAKDRILEWLLCHGGIDLSSLPNTPARTPASPTEDQFQEEVSVDRSTLGINKILPVESADSGNDVLLSFEDSTQQDDYGWYYKQRFNANGPIEADHCLG